MPTRTVSLRPAAGADEDVLLALFRAARPVFAALGPAATDDLVRMQQRAQRETWRRLWPGRREFVIEVDGAVVGSVVVDDSQSEQHILDICVDPDHRGQGIGSGVLRRLCDDATAAVTLWVATGNPARALYERLGFRVVERTPTDTFMRRRPEVPAT